RVLTWSKDITSRHVQAETRLLRNGYPTTPYSGIPHHQMSKRRHVILSITTRLVVSLALVALGVLILIALFATREVPGRAELADAVPRIPVVEVEPLAVARQWEGFGTAQARFAAEIPAQVRGLVIEVPFDIVE